MQTQPTVAAYGYCQCGCGHKTNLAPHTSRPQGLVKGEPQRYRRGHATRGRSWTWNSKATRYLKEDRGYETPCWIWQLAKNPDTGYGAVGDKGRVRPAHVVFYEQRHGTVPAGLQVDHLCRQRDCINPDHLEAVTSAENNRRASKKMTMQLADEIRRRYALGGITQEALGACFGVSDSTVSTIVRGEAWA